MSAYWTSHVKKYEHIYQLVVVCVAVVISIISLGYSCQANRNSSLAARPYLTMDFVPENGRFLRASVEGTNYVLSYTLKLKNCGQTPAMNIQFSDYVSECHSDGRIENTPFAEPPGVVSIAAEDESTASCGFRFPITGNPSNLVEKVEAGTFHVLLRIVAQYQGPFSRRENYYTGISCDLYANTRIIKGSSIK